MNGSLLGNDSRNNCYVILYKKDCLIHGCNRHRYKRSDREVLNCCLLISEDYLTSAKQLKRQSSKYMNWFAKFKFEKWFRSFREGNINRDM